MEFYQGIFGGELRITTFGELNPEAGDVADLVMHSQLETDDGYTLMASDTPPGMKRKEGNNITVSLSGEDESLRDYWDKLVEGGKVTLPFEKQVWGDEFGQCIDKFGVNWMVNVTHPQV